MELYIVKKEFSLDISSLYYTYSLSEVNYTSVHRVGITLDPK